jgi:hypothetical protein
MLQAVLGQAPAGLDLPTMLASAFPTPVARICTVALPSRRYSTRAVGAEGRTHGLHRPERRLHLDVRAHLLDTVGVPLRPHGAKVPPSMSQGKDPYTIRFDPVDELVRTGQ